MEVYFWLFIVSLVVAAGVFVYAFLLHRQIREFKERFKQFFGTKKNPHLSTVVMKNSETLKKMNGDIQQLYQAADELHKMAIRSTQKVGVNFYNPYGDTGGTFSFSIAMLDPNDNGIVISSLHTREGTRVYAKEINKGRSKQHLTEEEMEALRRANLS